MCKCTDREKLALTWENEKLKADVRRLTEERDRAIQTRNLAQARSTADALEKQQLQAALDRAFVGVTS